jgi:hypothetical protein
MLLICNAGIAWPRSLDIFVVLMHELCVIMNSWYMHSGNYNNLFTEVDAEIEVEEKVNVEVEEI